MTPARSMAMPRVARGHLLSGTVFGVFIALSVLSLSLATTAQAQDYQSVPVLKGDPNAADNPTINEIQSTPMGYVIVGLGFGQDPASVKVLEDGVAIAESAIAGVSTQRISVLSVPSQPTAITVEVGGNLSAAIDFNYVKPVEPPMPEMPAQDEALSPDTATAPAEPASNTETQPDATGESVDSESVVLINDADDLADNNGVSVASEGTVTDSNELEREVDVLRRRMESLEQEIYELKKALGTRNE